MKVFSAEDSLLLNFARAEEYLANEKAQPSIKDQITAARKNVAKKPSSKKAAGGAGAASVAAASSSGKSSGNRVGMSGVVHTREVTQIRRCFIDAATPVEVRGAPAEPEEDELERAGFGNISGEGCSRP